MENLENVTEMTPGTVVDLNESKAEKNVTESDTKELNYTHVLTKTFEYEDKKYTEFRFDFEKLTGDDMIAIENEMAAVGEYVVSPEISTSFLLKMAARAAGVGSDVIQKLPIRESGKIKNKSRDFLLLTGF